MPPSDSAAAMPSSSVTSSADEDGQAAGEWRALHDGADGEPFVDTGGAHLPGHFCCQKHEFVRLVDDHRAQGLLCGGAGVGGAAVVHHEAVAFVLEACAWMHLCQSAGLIEPGGRRVIDALRVRRFAWVVAQRRAVLGSDCSGRVPRAMHPRLSAFVR